MPELPDVESVIKRITAEILQRRILGISIRDRTLITESRLKPALGKRIEGITRRGNPLTLIVIGLKGGDKCDEVSGGQSCKRGAYQAFIFNN